MAGMHKEMPKGWYNSALCARWQNIAAILLLFKVYFIKTYQCFFSILFPEVGAKACRHPASICIRSALNSTVCTVPTRNRWLWGWSWSKYKCQICSKRGANQWHSAAVQFPIECTCRFGTKVWIIVKKSSLIDSCITFIDVLSQQRSWTRSF